MNDGSGVAVSIQLEPATIVTFELSSNAKDLITAETAYIICKATNVETGKPTPIVSPWGEENEYLVWLWSKDGTQDLTPSITLPVGRYDIQYRLFQDKKDYPTYMTQTPLLMGTVRVELAKRETKRVIVSP